MLNFQPPSSVLQFNEGSCSGVAFNHSDGLAAICTENYRIQFYSLFDDREISEVILFRLESALCQLQSNARPSNLVSASEISGLR